MIANGRATSKHGQDSTRRAIAAIPSQIHACVLSVVSVASITVFHDGAKRWHEGPYLVTRQLSARYKPQSTHSACESCAAFERSDHFQEPVGPIVGCEAIWLARLVVWREFELHAAKQMRAGARLCAASAANAVMPQFQQ